MSPRLLVVEDDSSISEPLGRLLTAEGYEVTVATKMRDAERLAAACPPDLVLLDWMLPDGAGIDLLRAWRRNGFQVPVILLTARSDLIDKVLGLELGADDYVTKPFDGRELLARIQARLRQIKGLGLPSARPLVHAGIELDHEMHAVTYRGRIIDLTRMEYALLKLLLENIGKVFSRDELLNRVWGYDSYPTTRTVDTHILQLRQKFAAELFETVRGIGYRLVKVRERS